MPPALAREGSKNFAMPVGAGGVAQVVPYLDGFLLDIDFDRPQAKVSPPTSGPLIIQVAPGFHVERFVLDHEAFDRCPNFSE